MSDFVPDGAPGKPAGARAPGLPPSLQWLASPPAVAGLLALLLYVSCVAPTVTYGGDCGELISASWRLGIAHPTGYALYCLAGKTFALLLPLGEVAWRYNLFAAVCGALAIALCAASIGRVLALPDAADAAGLSTSPAGATPLHGVNQPRWLAACGGSLLLGAFFYFWSQCVLAEIYATAALLLSALIFCAVSWRRSGDWRWLYSLALLFGLALNAHLSCVYLAPGLAWYCLWPTRAQLRPGWPRTVLRLALLFLAGYSIAVYLPLRASAFPQPVGKQWAPLDWTHPVDFGSFWTHVTARQYRIWLLTEREVSLGGLQFSAPQWVQAPAATRAKLVNFAAMCALQLGWCTPLLLAGAWASWRREKALFILLASTVLLNIGVQIHYTVGDAPNFFFPAYLVFGIWLGLGIEACARRWNVRAVGVAVAGMLVLQASVFFPMISQRGQTRAREDAVARAAALESLKARGTPSAFILADDALWAFWYAQFVLGRGQGVATPWGPERTAALKKNALWRVVAEAKQRGPVVMSQFDEGTDTRFPLVPLTLRGDLWLASNRELPPPATFLGGQGAADSVVAAARWPGARTEEVAREVNGSGVREQVAVLKRSDMAALELSFRVPAALLRPLGQLSPRENAKTCGWIEVLLATEGELKQPKPAQGELRTEAAGVSPLIAWREDRRLILPLDARPGVYRTVIPVNLHKDARLGQHRFWTRIVRQRHDERTPWQQRGVIRLSSD